MPKKLRVSGHGTLAVLRNLASVTQHVDVLDSSVDCIQTLLSLCTAIQTSVLATHSKSINYDREFFTFFLLISFLLYTPFRQRRTREDLSKTFSSWHKTEKSVRRKTAKTVPGLLVKLLKHGALLWTVMSCFKTSHFFKSVNQNELQW